MSRHCDRGHDDNDHTHNPYRYVVKLSAEELGAVILQHQMMLSPPYDPPANELAWRHMRIHILTEYCP